MKKFNHKSVVKSLALLSVELKKVKNQIDESNTGINFQSLELDSASDAILDARVKLQEAIAAIRDFGGSY